MCREIKFDQFYVARKKHADEMKQQQVALTGKKKKEKQKASNWFWVGRSVQQSPKLSSQGDLFVRRNKTTEKKHNMLVRCHPSVRKPRHSYSTGNQVIYIVF